jgi:acyl dehydratase
MDIKELKTGTELPEEKHRITQERVNLYAEASGDFNPIHIDPEFAKQTELGGTVAHGMLVLAYVSEYMTGIFGIDWLTGGTLNIRFKAPARPGDTLAVTGKVSKIDETDGNRTVYGEILCRNQDDEAVITGETKVRVSEI